MISSILIGVGIYFFFRVILFGFFTIDQNERAVKTVFGKALRLGLGMSNETPIAESLNADEKKRYNYPLLQVIGPGLHFKWPWEKIYKVSVSTETVSMAYDPENPRMNSNGTILDAVTRDQLNIGLTGQLRYRVAEQNLYAYVFGVKNPIVHVMGYFISILREKIACYERKETPDSDVTQLASEAISINDLRKNLRDINDLMIQESQSSVARYGIVLEASLITGIEPPAEVESALAAINTAHNNVSSEISLAKASADQTIVQSKRAVEIETLKAHAEVEPLVRLAEQLRTLKQSGRQVLEAFVRNVRLETFTKARKIFTRMN